MKHRYARDGIAAFVHGMSYGRIPHDARHAAKRLLLDSLACIAGGWSEPSARIARTVAEELGETTSGETHTCRVDYRRGDPGNPDADIEKKFEALSSRHMPKAWARRIVDMVWSLEKQKDINRLAESFLTA